MSKQRFFSQFYDSTRQSLSGTGELVPYDAFLGRLRFDTLLSEKLIVTDTQILDGTIFQAHGSGDFLRQLQRNEEQKVPIEIQSRATDLEAALLRLVHPEGADRLKGFVFSSITSDAERKMVATELPTTPTSGIIDIKSLVRRLRDLGVDAGNMDALEAAWSHWVELTRGGLVVVNPWGKNGRDVEAFKHHRQNEMEKMRDQVSRIAFGAAEERALLGLIDTFDREQDDHGKAVDRSYLDGEYHDFYETYSDPAVQRLAAKVYDAYDRCYHASFAAQHKCDTQETLGTNSLDGPSILEVKEASHIGQIKNIPESVIEMLAEMTSKEYMFHILSRDLSFQRWWKHGDDRALTLALEPILTQAEQFEPPSPNPNSAWPWVAIKGIAGAAGALGGIAAVGALGGIAGAIAGQYGGAAIGQYGDIIAAGAAGGVVRPAVEAGLTNLRLRFILPPGAIAQRVLDVARERRRIE